MLVQQEQLIASEEIPDVEEITRFQKLLEAFQKYYKALATTREQITKLKNLIRAASNAVTFLLAYPDRVLNSIQDLAMFPFEIEANIVQAMKALEDTIDDTVFLFQNLGSPGSALLNESVLLSLTAVNAMCAVNGKYKNRNEVINSSEKLRKSLKSVTELFEINKYIPNPSNSIEIDNMYNSVLANLHNVAFDSAIERTVILEKDTNIIELAHRFYTASDESVERIISENDLSIVEYIQIKKGRSIIFNR
jgi:hypothetical protein